MNHLKLSAIELVKSLNGGNFSATNLADQVWEAVQQQKHLNCFTAHLDTKTYRAAAQQADLRRQQGRSLPLDGIPVVVKDNINSATLPTSAGTKALQNNQVTESAPALKSLEDAGAIVVGKTNMHELAFGITSNNAFTGAVQNPVSPGMIPGGSSGGTAAAVAANIVPVGLGTDTGGSCRIPAALCGIYGFRPSTNRYNSSGLVQLSTTRDTIGIVARFVEDIALIDQHLRANKVEKVEDVAIPNVSELRIACPPSILWQNLEPSLQRQCEAAILHLQEAGATVIATDMPHEIWQLNEAVSFPVVLYEFLRTIPEYLKNYAPHISFQQLIDQITSPDVRDVFAIEPVSEDIYQQALNHHRPKLQQVYQDFFTKHRIHAIAFPTTPLTAQPIGQDSTVSLNGVQVPTFPTYIRNTDLASNVGAPGISIPIANTTGKCIGLEFDALPGKDASLLALAQAVSVQTLEKPRQRV